MAEAKPPVESTLIRDEVMSERRKFLAKIPPVNVEVAVPVTSIWSLTNKSPATERTEFGVVVPIPTLPLESITNAVLVARSVDVEILNKSEVLFA